MLSFLKENLSKELRTPATLGAFHDFQLRIGRERKDDCGLWVCYLHYFMCGTDSAMKLWPNLQFYPGEEISWEEARQFHGIQSSSGTIGSTGPGELAHPRTTFDKQSNSPLDDPSCHPLDERDFD